MHSQGIVHRKILEEEIVMRHERKRKKSSVRKNKRLIVSCLIYAATLFLISCTTDKDHMYKKGSDIMDTKVEITVVSESADKAEKAIDAAFAEIRRLERLLSFWTEDSEIALIYENAGKSPVAVSPETFDIIKKSLYVSEKTAGAFDPTVGPLIRLWDFWEKKKPENGELEKALLLVDYSAMSLNKEESTAYLSRKGMSFDTGGIAKGYAADRAVDVLMKMDIRAGLVSVAGDIKAFGQKPDGKGWNVGIRDPRSEDSDELIATIELMDESISTSGDYERFFIEESIRYHHILDPQTGHPAQGCMSVTVVAKDAVMTDGFSTGVFVLGPEKGLQLLGKLGFEGVIIASNGERYLTEGIKDRVKWNSSQH
jgi:thiamine biosynthesis lipoprotein